VVIRYIPGSMNDELQAHETERAVGVPTAEADDDLPTDALGAADDVLVELGLPQGFLMGLLAEDDWTFVLKVAALLEGAVAHSLRSRFRQFNLDEFIDALPHRKRIDLAKSSASVGPGFLPGLHHIARVRNLLAHDVSQVSFAFETYYQDTDKLNGFKSSVLVGNVDVTVGLPGGIETPFRELLVENPKLAVVRFAVAVLSEVYFSTRHDELDEGWGRMLRDLSGTPGEAVT
jgi:hypothetical protein